MSRDDMRVADTFNWQQSIFGACNQESKTLLFVLEAKDFEEARARVDLVAPLLGINQVSDLLVFELEELPSGVPTFLNPFFTGAAIGFNRGNVAPGTTTLQ